MYNTYTKCSLADQFRYLNNDVMFYEVMFDISVFGRSFVRPSVCYYLFVSLTLKALIKMHLKMSSAEVVCCK